MIDIPTYIIADLKFLCTAEGGRQGYADSGYKPEIVFDGYDYQTASQQKFIGKDKIFPGEEVRSEIIFIATDYYKGKLFVGQKFKLQEASRVVATGIILEVFNKDLEKKNG